MLTIYKLTSPSGKAYIGITAATIEERWKWHRHTARKGINRPLYNAMRTFTIMRMWKKEILHHITDKETALKKEREEITNHSTLHPAGYNLSTGGQLPSGPALKAAWADPVKKAERIRKMRIITTSPEFKAKCKAAMNRPEVKANIAAAIQRRKELNALKPKPAKPQRPLLSKEERGKRISAGMLASTKPRKPRKQVNMTAEEKKRISDKVKVALTNYWTPERREEARVKAHALWTDPDYKRKATAWLKGLDKEKHKEKSIAGMHKGSVA